MAAKNNTVPARSWLVVALYAVGLSGVALTTVTEASHHYPIIMELCGGESSGCADVASTPFARMFGVSVAYWGLLSYVAFLFLLTYARRWIVPYAAALVGAELYFYWVMAAVIETFCMFCLIQFVTVLILFALCVAWQVKQRAAPPHGWWPAPVIIAVAFAALAGPVWLKSAPGGAAGELITYEGDPASRVRVEIYSDYQCGHCRKFEAQVEKIVRNHPNVLIVYRNYVIRSNPLSPVAASYANAIAFLEGPEAFVKTHRELFINQPTLYGYLKPRLEKITFTDELKRKIKEKVEADMKAAESAGVYSTPTTVIYRDNAMVQLIRGDTEYERFASFLAQ